ncbi:MAG TPA: ComF family protein [Vicinamibacteria bacterium]|nr:ComF family protein [Vicinamibacteria bacterium]
MIPGSPRDGGRDAAPPGSIMLGAARLIVDPVLSLVFPAWCPSCAAPVDRPTRGPLCEACWDALPVHEAECACGQPLAAPLASSCGRCRRGLGPFTRGASLGPYAGPLRVLVHELKYRGRRRAAARLAECLLARPSVRGTLQDADVVVPVPLHPRRKRERGFNQSEELARALGRAGGLAVAPTALVRRTDTVSQSGLSAAARRRNVAGAFAVRGRAQVAGRVVVLVDDVYTTGATARACAAALREGGAREIRVVTVARVH